MDSEVSGPSPTPALTKGGALFALHPGGPDLALRELGAEPDLAQPDLRAGGGGGLPVSERGRATLCSQLCWGAGGGGDKNTERVSALCSSVYLKLLLPEPWACD